MDNIIGAVYSEKMFTSNPWSANQLYQARKLSVITPTTADKLFIYNLNTKDSIELLLIPNSLSENYSSRIAQETSIYGRLRPINIYTGGNSKTLSFSFDLFEDLHNIEGSLYKLLARLKDMSKPVYGGARQMIQEPLVYFQLGGQFAGKGHITSEYSLSKPFRKDSTGSNNGRYAAASVTITFTFHEEFETPYSTPLADGATVVSTTGINLNNALQSFNSNLQDWQQLSLEDFIEEAEATKYFILQSFASEKLLGGYLNAVRVSSDAITGYRTTLQDNLNTSQRIDVATLLYATASISQYGTTSGRMVSPLQAIIVNYYIDLSNILSSDLVLANAVQALTNFGKLVYDTYTEYKGQAPYVTGSYSGNVTLVVIAGYPSITVSAGEFRLFLNELLDLTVIIARQKSVHLAIFGAGA